MQNEPLNEQPPKQKLISIADLVKRWGCSRHFIWEKCKSGEIPANKIGERWFINVAWVEEYEDDMRKKENERTQEWFRNQLGNAIRPE